MENHQLLLASLALLSLALAAFLVRERARIRKRAETLFSRWREEELDRERRDLRASLESQYRSELERWKLLHESRIRDDAVKRSRASFTGKLTEHLVPYLGRFPFDPRDVRFLGTPVDLVVFDGLSAGALREIVLVEVKTGRSASLSERERQVRDVVEAKRMRWHELRVPTAAASLSRESYFLLLESEDGDRSAQLEVLADRGKLRYWSDWSEAPEEYALDPRKLFRERDELGLKLERNGDVLGLSLGNEARVEIDRQTSILNVRAGRNEVRYRLPEDKLIEAGGETVLKLDGGR